MATNLVSLVMQFLTPDMIGRIATALGFDRNKVQSAIDAAVPAILATFNDVSTQPGGAQKLADTARQQVGSLGNFASVLAAELAQGNLPDLDHLRSRFAPPLAPVPAVLVLLPTIGSYNVLLPMTGATA